MKAAHKKTNIFIVIVSIAIVFLCVINISFAYFSAKANKSANTEFYDLDVSFAYWKDADDYMAVSKTSTNQLVLSSLLSRNSYSEIKKSASDEDPLHTIGFVTSANSCNTYVRFWIEVFAVEEIKGETCFIDSKGNYVNVDGDYVDIEGNIITVDDADKGVVIDYAQYFELGVSDSGVFTAVSNIGQQGTTYYVKESLAAGAEHKLGINAIKMLESAPNELLNLNMCIYFSFEAVQADEDAVWAEFNDSRGYYGDWL